MKDQKKKNTYILIEILGKIINGYGKKHKNPHSSNCTVGDFLYKVKKYIIDEVISKIYKPNNSVKNNLLKILQKLTENDKIKK